MCAWVRHLHSRLVLRLSVLGQVQPLSVLVKDYDALGSSLSSPVFPSCTGCSLNCAKGPGQGTRQRWG